MDVYVHAQTVHTQNMRLPIHYTYVHAIYYATQTRFYNLADPV